MAQWIQSSHCPDDLWILPVSLSSHHTLEEGLMHEGFSEGDIARLKKKSHGLIILDEADLPSAECLSHLEREWPIARFVIISRSRSYDSVPVQLDRDAAICRMQPVPEDLLMAQALLKRVELSLSARELLCNPLMLALFLQEANPTAMVIERFHLFQNFWVRSIDLALKKIKAVGLPLAVSDASMREALVHFSFQQAASQVGRECGWEEDPRLTADDVITRSCRRYYILPQPIIEFVFAHYAYCLLRDEPRDERIHARLHAILSRLSLPVADRVSEYFALFLSKNCGHALIRQIPALIQQFAGRIIPQFVLPTFLPMVQGLLGTLSLGEAPGTAVEEAMVDRLIAWMRDLATGVQSGAKILLARAITTVILGPLRLTVERYQDRLNRQVGAEAWQGVPPDLLAILQPYFHCDLSAVRFATGVDTYHHMNMTLGHRIYLVTPPDFLTTSGFYNFVYMLAHVEQFHEHGGLEPFIFRYLTEALFQGYALLPALERVGLNGIQAYILAVHDQMGLEHNAKIKADQMWQAAFHAYIRTHPVRDGGRARAEMRVPPPKKPEVRTQEALSFAQQLLSSIPSDAPIDFHRTALRAHLLARVLMETTQAVGPSPEAQTRARVLAFSLLSLFGQFTQQDQVLMQAGLSIPPREAGFHSRL